MAFLPNFTMGVMTMPWLFNTENMTPEQYHQLTLTDPKWFLFHCRSGGYAFEVVNASLKITPLHAIDDEMRTLLKQYKPELVKLLERKVIHGINT